MIKMSNIEKELTGKKLLILGGTSASLDLVKLAQSMGAYVIVTDEADTEQRVSKQIADEVAMVSTNDIEGLAKLVKEKNIDGAFCGPSEFNLKNVIDLCSKMNLPCYATPEQWEMCSNKEVFKRFCRENNVPTAPEYEIDEFLEEGKDEKVEYPVIVKPVDGCSSKGISICRNREEVQKAYEFALSFSKSKNVVIEQYIDNGGVIFSFRYILKDGNYYPYLAFDTYIADPINKKCLISAFTYYPSNYINTFFAEINDNVKTMFKNMGLKNGVAFIQAIPYKGKIYCHEMGFRLSGGMIYKITAPLMDINDMKMMLRFALGGEIATEEELSRINLQNQNIAIAQLMIPLECGTIDSIQGLDEILMMPNVIDFLQYYKEGDTITPEVYGSLGQHFGRFTLKCKNKEEMIKIINVIQDLLKIRNINGEEMYRMRFDVVRIC